MVDHERPGAWHFGALVPTIKFDILMVVQKWSCQCHIIFLIDDSSHAVCSLIVAINLDNVGLNVQLSGGPMIILGKFVE